MTYQVNLTEDELIALIQSNKNMMEEYRSAINTLPHEEYGDELEFARDSIIICVGAQNKLFNAYTHEESEAEPVEQNNDSRRD